MVDVPLKAWKRAFLYTLLGSAPLVAALYGAVHSKGWGRLAGVAFALAIAAAAGAIAWLFLPDVDLPGRTIRRGNRAKRAIAITFDDGPNGAHTTKILDTLDRHGAKATFFCVGQFARAQPELIRRMSQAGHAIGNHTWSHRLLPRASAFGVARELLRTQAAIEAAGAPRPTLFRAPKGFKSFYLPRVLARERLRLVGWTRGVWDTDRPGPDVIARRAKKALEPGAILLLHDGLRDCDRAQTADALEEILAECRRRGLACVTVPELLSKQS